MIVVVDIPLVGVIPASNDGRSEGRSDGTKEGMDDGNGLEEDGSAEGDELVVGFFGVNNSDGPELEVGNAETAVAGALLIDTSIVP